MESAEVVRAEIRAVLRARGEAAPAISDADALTEVLGLDSAEVLALVPSLNAQLGVDPFKGALAITDVRTVGDLVRAYGPADAHGASAALDAATARAALRRSRTGR